MSLKPKELALRPTLSRAILTGLLGVALLVAVPACPREEGIGDPCTLELEYDPSFTGFDEKQAVTESKSFQCRSRLCLANHFRGRSTCPYGQSIEGNPPPGAKGSCTIPGTNEPVSGLTDPGNPESFRDPRKRKLVAPQCVDRTADKTVYCSCRCADINGNKPSDQTFCACPDGFTCSQLVTSVDRGDEGLTGSYCIKNGTEYDRNTSCNQGDCTPGTSTCGE